MGLRETDGSLRAFMLLTGVLEVLIGSGELLLGPEPGIPGWLPPILSLVEGAAFVWAGLTLRQALVRGTRGIERVLIASGALIFAEGALVTAAGGSQSTLHDAFGLAWDVITMAVGLAITIYLYRSTVRLSTEAIARAGLPSAPPTATIV